MANIGQLALMLTAKTTPLTAALSTAGEKVKGFVTGALSALGNILKKITVAVTTLITTFTAMMKQEAAALDRVGKFADELGIASDSMMAFRVAADLSGTSIATLDKGLQILTRRLGEAQLGQGEARAGLKKLGLNAEELSRVPLDDAILQISDRLAELSSQTAKSGVLFTLFSRQGQDLQNFMVDLRKNIIKIKEFNFKTGFAPSRNQIRRWEMMNDSVELVKNVISGMVRTIGNRIAPIVTLVARRFTEWATSGEGVRVKIEEILNWIEAAIVDALNTWPAPVMNFVAKVVDAFNWMGVAILGVIDRVFNFYVEIESRIRAVRATIVMGIVAVVGTLTKLASTVVSLGSALHIPGMKLLEDGLDAVTEKSREFNIELKEGVTENIAANRARSDALSNFASTAESSYGKAGDAIRNFGKTMDDLQLGNKVAREINKINAEARIPIKDVKSPVADLSEEYEKLKEKALDMYESTRTPAEEFKGQVEELNLMFRTGFINQQLYNRGLQEAQKDFVDSAVAAEDFDKSLEGIGQEAKVVSRSSSAVFGKIGDILAKQNSKSQKPEEQFAAKMEGVANRMGSQIGISMKDVLAGKVDPVKDFEQVKTNEILSRIERKFQPGLA